MADEDVSILPSEAVEGGGGLLQSVKGATLKFRWVMFDYNGSIAVASPALHINISYEDEEGEDQEKDEYYSAGSADKLRAAKDGSRLVAVSEGAKMTTTCKAMQLLASLVSANGGDEDILKDTGGDIRKLDGINVDLERKADVDRPGLEQKNNRKRTILLITEINAMPGEKVKKGAKSAATGKAKGKANDRQKKAIECVVETLKANDGELSVEDLPTTLFRKFKKSIEQAELKAIMELVGDEDFLGGDDLPWTVEDDTVKLTEEE